MSRVKCLSAVTEKRLGGAGIKSRKKRPLLFVLSVIMQLGAVPAIVSASEVYSDDFSSDPFSGAARWVSRDHSWGNSRFEYDWLGSGDQTIDFVTLMFGGKASLVTTATTSVDASRGYSIDVDFRWNQWNRLNSINVWVQRQSNGERYYLELAATGIAGQAKYVFGGGGINTWHSDYCNPGTLQIGVWYTLHVEVFDTGDWVEIKAVVYDDNDDIVIGWSPKIIDSTRAYTTNSGFGVTCWTGVTDAGNYIDLDNFIVVEEERYCCDDRRYSRRQSSTRIRRS